MPVVGHCLLEKVKRSYLGNLTRGQEASKGGRRQDKGAGGKKRGAGGDIRGQEAAEGAGGEIRGRKK